MVDKIIKIIKLILHYHFGKHKWVFKAKFYQGNEEKGYKESEYLFVCKICGKEKRVKVCE